VTDWGPTPGITKKLFRNLWSYEDVVDVTVLQWEAERMSSFDLAVFDSQVDLEMVDRVARWMGSLGPLVVLRIGGLTPEQGCEMQGARFWGFAARGRIRGTVETSKQHVALERTVGMKLITWS
jgi:hypothetical protein